MICNTCGDEYVLLFADNRCKRCRDFTIDPHLQKMLAHQARKIASEIIRDHMRYYKHEGNR